MNLDLTTWQTRDLIVYAGKQTAKLLRSIHADNSRSMEAEEIAAVLLELLKRQTEEAPA